MKFRKILAGLLLISMVITSGGIVLAIDKESMAEDIEEISSTNAEGEEERQNKYFSFTGTVKKIEDWGVVEGSKILAVENEAGQPANIIISEKAYILDNEDIVEGAVITCYYDADKPMILIYPPQYNAEVVVVEREDRNVKFDVFDENLISSDNFLKLNVSDETEIVLSDGASYEGELTNKKLVVIYGAATKSIPAQTTPSRIIVLPDEDEEEMFIWDVSDNEIVVNNEIIEAPSPYINEEKTAMVPLRAIAEALGYEVLWDGDTQSVMVGAEISLVIGEDNYKDAGADVINLGTAPELKNSLTYVPLNFFKKVIKMNNAYAFEAQIVIDNEEIMH